MNGLSKERKGTSRHIVSQIDTKKKIKKIFISSFFAKIKFQIGPKQNAYIFGGFFLDKQLSGIKTKKNG